MPVRVPSFDGGYFGHYNIPVPRLEQMFNALASTGELPQIEAPKGLKNISYVVEFFAPLWRCRVSDAVVTAHILSNLYEKVHSDFSRNIKLDTFALYPQNLTFKAGRYRGYVGYFTMGHEDFNAGYKEIYIAISHPSMEQKEHMNDNLTASYYTCKPYNTSIATTISYMNNQVITSTVVHEKEFTNPGIAPSYRQQNYCIFYDAWYNRIKGLMYIARVYFTNGYSGDQIWQSHIDQTIFSTAADFSGMSARWRKISNDDHRLVKLNYVTQEKILIALIEEFALNATLALMSIPSFK